MIPDWTSAASISSFRSLVPIDILSMAASLWFTGTRRADSSRILAPETAPAAQAAQFSDARRGRSQSTRRRVPAGPSGTAPADGSLDFLACSQENRDTGPLQATGAANLRKFREFGVGRPVLLIFQ